MLCIRTGHLQNLECKFCDKRWIRDNWELKPLFNVLTFSRFNCAWTHHSGEASESGNTALLHNPGLTRTPKMKEMSWRKMVADKSCGDWRAYRLIQARIDKTSLRSADYVKSLYSASEFGFNALRDTPYESCLWGNRLNWQLARS